jgi:hypothetical protein
MAPLLDLSLQGLELNLAGPTVRQINAAIYYGAGCTAHAKVVLPKKDSVCATSNGICQLTLCF